MAQRALWLVGMTSLSLSLFLRLWADAPVGWPVLAILALVGLAAFLSALTKMLARKGEGRPGLWPVLGYPSRAWVLAGASLMFAGWALTMTGVVGSGSVVYSDGAVGCRYYVVQSGERTCVPSEEYQSSLADQQSMGMGGVAFFLGVSVVAVGDRRGETTEASIAA